MVEPRIGPQPGTGTPRSVLPSARDELLERCRLADAAGDWQEREILSLLADVADYLKRIGNHRDSTHYRAEKAGALLHAAIRVERETLLAYAGWPEESDDERAIMEASELLEDIIGQVRAAMWRSGRHARGDDSLMCRHEAAELSTVVRRLSRWADEQVLKAGPDYGCA